MVAGDIWGIHRGCNNGLIAIGSGARNSSLGKIYFVFNDNIQANKGVVVTNCGIERNVETMGVKLPIRNGPYLEDKI